MSLLKSDHSWSSREVSKKKISRQYWKKYFWTFSTFSTIFLHHKWNETRLLSKKREFTSCLRKLENFKKIPEMLGIKIECSARHLKGNFDTFVRSCKTLHWKTYFTWLHDSIDNVLSNTVHQVIIKLLRTYSHFSGKSFN